MTIGHQLSLLEARDLIQLETALPELAYVFRHVLAREAVYATLVRRERRRLHQAVGEVLESSPVNPGAARPLASELGAHFAEAGDGPRALHYLTLAGDQAARQYANREAAQYYARALELAQQQAGAALTHLFVARGQALELSGDYSAALATYENMEALARERQDEALELEALTAQARLGNVFTPVSDPVRGRVVLDQALQMARRRGDRATEARLLLYLMRKYAWTGETDQVVTYGEQAVEAARSLGQPLLLVEALNELARWGYMNVPGLWLARRRLDEAQELLRGLADSVQQLENLIGQGMLAGVMGDFERAERLLPDLEAISQVMGSGWGMTHYHTLRGQLRLERGELGDALADLLEGIRLGSQYSVGHAELIVCAYLSRLYFAVGETAAGLQAVRAARDRIPPQLPFLLAWPLAAEGLLLLVGGQVEAAASAIAQARQVGRVRETILYRLLLRSEAELGLAQGNYREVIGHTEVVIRDLRAEGANVVLCEALAYQGRALLGAGDLERAQVVLSEARALAEAGHLRLLMWPVLAALADLAGCRGDQAEAGQIRRELRAVIGYLAERTGSAERRAHFMGSTAVKAALEPD